MGKRDPRVDAYIAKAAPFARPILKHLRAIIHEGCPGVEETIKWSFPCYDYKGPFASIAAFKQHASFGLWKHALLVKKHAPLAKNREKAMGHFGRLTSLADLPSRRVLVALVKEAKRLNDERVKLPPRPRPKKPVKVMVPAFFRAALRKSKKAFACFDAFSPSQQREYVEWLAEAKTAPTRERRLETAIEWISEGKIRNWKYVRKKKAQPT
jgi:uncharacterized protein YdeI (YjbR/CyaY-like superfamily)